MLPERTVPVVIIDASAHAGKRQIEGQWKAEADERWADSGAGGVYFEALAGCRREVSVATVGPCGIEAEDAAVTVLVRTMAARKVALAAHARDVRRAARLG